MALRLRHVGPVCFAPWAFSSTRVWTPSTGSRRDARTPPRRWASSSTMAVTPYPRCSWPCRRAFPANWDTTPTGCSSRWVDYAKLIQSEINSELLFQCFCAIALFYCAHWQTYVSGTMRFGRIDVTEAQFSIIAIHLVSAVLGPEIWLSKVGEVLKAPSEDPRVTFCLKPYFRKFFAFLFILYLYILAYF